MLQEFKLLKAEVAGLKNDNTNMQTKLARLSVENADLKAEIVALRTENANTRAGISRMNASITTVSHDIN